MATYHICDLCGKDLKNDDNPFRIIVGPEKLYRNISSSQTSYANKEICQRCAEVFSNLIEEVAKRRDAHKKVLSLGIADIDNKEIPEPVFFNLNYDN